MANHQALTAAGVGYRVHCTAGDIFAAVIACAQTYEQPLDCIRLLCAAYFKAGSKQLEMAADLLGTELLFFSHGALEAYASQAITFSPLVIRRFGLPSIAETAALAGAVELSGGKGSARLLGARQVVGGVSCALAAPAEPPA